MAIQVNGFYPGAIAPDSTVAGCIDIFKNVWPDTKGTIELVENECSNPSSGMTWKKATTVGSGVFQSKRTNYHLGVSQAALEEDNVLAQSIHNQMYMLLLAATVPYMKKHDIDYLYHEGYNMLKYSTGQEYKAHADGFSSSGRCVSAIIYLNDDYEGGEVEFVNFGVKIKPEPGMLLLFPSTFPYTHIAHPVKDGTKYALVTWLRDRVVNN